MPDRFPKLMFVHVAVALSIGLLSVLAAGCASSTADPSPDPDSPQQGFDQVPPRSEAIRFIRVDASGITPIEPGVGDDPQRPLTLHAAGNEWIGQAIELLLGKLPRPATQLSLSKLTSVADPKLTLELSDVSVSQIVSVPAEVNRASFLRQTGPASTGDASLRSKSVARVLVPLVGRGGAFDLSTITSDRLSSSPLLWIDFRTARDVAPGQWVGTIDLLDARNRVVAQLGFVLSTWNFALPDDRNLTLHAQAPWSRWQALFPDEFEAVTPRLVRREDARYARVVQLFDQAVRLAHDHRVSVGIDRLQPTIKWSVGEPVSIDWEDYDSVVRPWLDGSMFADRVPVTMWPLPVPDPLSNWPDPARRQYWESTAAHFDARDWLARSPVWLDQIVRSGLPKQDELLAEARLVLDSSPRIRVVAGVDAAGAQQLPNADQPILSPAKGRFWSLAIPLVANQTTPTWAELLKQPPTWLDTTREGLLPTGGYGTSQQDVRVWAWLAFFRNASCVRLGHALPSTNNAQTPAPVDEGVLFYPGKWFGRDGLLPTLQLKWLRRAQQDFEYLRLARDRGEVLNAVVMARLLTKPVELQPRQSADPVFGLMTGTQDARAWEAAMPLLAQTIMLRPPGSDADIVDRGPLNLRTLQWMEPQERPLLVGRSTVFTLISKPSQRWPEVELALGIDLYNASDTTPEDNALQFTRLPPGWVVEPRPERVPPLEPYRVTRHGVRAAVNTSRIVDDAQPVGGQTKPGEVTVSFIHGFTKRQTDVPMVVPVAVIQRREGGLSINGSLDDWTADDSIQSGPLVRMLDRPMIQTHQLQRATTNTELFATWSSEQVYFAFKLGGLDTAPVRSAQNFVQYDFRRAWGEDLAQLIVQAVYTDGSVSLPIHVALKPNGGIWTERKLSDNTWDAFDAGIRYATTSDNAAGESVWRGEVAIPFRSIQSASTSSTNVPAVPVLLRFNFTQHQHATGNSSTWAGPVDHGRDDAFTGAILLVERK